MPFDGIRNSALVRTLADVLEDLPDLLQKEMRLAQAEFTEKIKKGVQASVWMIVAGLLGLMSFFILIQAAIFAIASLGLGLHWSCLIVRGMATSVTDLSATVRGQSPAALLETASDFRRMADVS
jgi:hypothetical protein